MFVCATPTGTEFYANSPSDHIRWSEVCPGLTVIELNKADYQETYDWANAGHYTGGRAPTAPTLITPASGDPGTEAYKPAVYEDDGDPGKPDDWVLLGNSVALDDTGTVTLAGPTGEVHKHLVGNVVQASQAPPDA